MEVIQILLQYRTELICVLFLLLSLLVRLIPKKITGVSEQNLHLILESIPEFIKNAEAVYGSGHGVMKKAFVLSLIDMLKIKLGSVSDYDFDAYIEKLLDIPQKKGEKNG